MLRPDLPVNLVESNRKKAIFLKEAVSALQISNLRVINQRFEEINDTTESDCVVTRALDGMHGLLPVILTSVKLVRKPSCLAIPLYRKRQQNLSAQRGK